MQDNRRTAADGFMARVARQDRGAFDSLYRATADWVHAICLSILGDRRAAEDAVLAVYREVWAGAGAQAASGLSAAAWLVALIRRVALDRRGDGMPPLPPDGEPAAVDAARQAGTLATLAPEETAALRAAALQGRAPADAAPLDAAIRALAAASEPQAADEVLAARLAMGALDEGARTAAAARQQGDAGFARQVRGWHERIAHLATEVTPVLVPDRTRLALDRSLGHALPSDLGKNPIRPVGGTRAAKANGGGGWFWIALLAILILGGAGIILWPQIRP